jgi:hypothetical protein
MSSSVLQQTVALQKNAPRKDGQDARAFRVACSKRLGISPRQDAAYEHQRSSANLGFAAERPKERRAGCPCFP